jgi:hypothetical protein
MFSLECTTRTFFGAQQLRTLAVTPRSVATLNHRFMLSRCPASPKCPRPWTSRVSVFTAAACWWAADPGARIVWPIGSPSGRRTTARDRAARHFARGGQLTRSPRRTLQRPHTVGSATRYRPRTRLRPRPCHQLVSSPMPRAQTVRRLAALTATGSATARLRSRRPSAAAGETAQA